MLCYLKYVGVLSAKQACTLAWWAAKAGAVGPSQKLGLRPDCQSGQYSQRFDEFTRGGLGSVDLYHTPMGRRVHFEAARRFDDLPVRLPHEALREEILSSREPAERLEVALRDRSLPPKYFDHEFVRTAPAGTKVHPLALYLDYVAFTRTDIVLGIFHLFC